MNQPVQGAVLGLFGPDDQLADATCTLVVNLDYSNALNTRVTGPGGNLSVFDPATGTWIAQGHAWADVSLLPGGGVLVGLTSAVPEPSPLVLLVTGLIGLLCYAWRKMPLWCSRPGCPSRRDACTTSYSWTATERKIAPWCVSIPADLRLLRV